MDRDSCSAVKKPVLLSYAIPSGLSWFSSSTSPDPESAIPHRSSTRPIPRRRVGAGVPGNLPRRTGVLLGLWPPLNQAWIKSHRPGNPFRSVAQASSEPSRGRKSSYLLAPDHLRVRLGPTFCRATQGLEPSALARLCVQRRRDAAQVITLFGARLATLRGQKPRVRSDSCCSFRPRRRRFPGFGHLPFLSRS